MANPTFQAEVDSVTPPEWSGLLERFEDANIYQTWSYGAVHWAERQLSHLVFRQDGEIVGIAQLRIVRPRFLRCGIAYLRWGPLYQLRGGDPERSFLRQVALVLKEEYVQKRRLFLRIVPSVTIGSERASGFQEAFADYTFARRNPSPDRTFRLDLAPSLEELRKRLDQKWRNQLNRAEKGNLSVLEGSGTVEYELFLRIYREMWNRKRFRTTVDATEFRRIAEDLPNSLKPRILICQADGVPVAGMVCSAMGNSGIYLLGATSDVGLQAKGSYLLQWSMIKWLKGNGFRFYDLGGIDPESNPGVFHFKKGLAGQDVTRLAPLESCQNRLSWLCMQAADVAQGTFRRSGPRWWKTWLPRRRERPVPIAAAN